MDLEIEITIVSTFKWSIEIKYSLKTSQKDIDSLSLSEEFFKQISRNQTIGFSYFKGAKLPSNIISQGSKVATFCLKSVCITSSTICKEVVNQVHVTTQTCVIPELKYLYLMLAHKERRTFDNYRGVPSNSSRTLRSTSFFSKRYLQDKFKSS